MSSEHDLIEIISGSRNNEEAFAASANLFRGMIIAHYAHVEWVFTDFIVRCSNIENYQTVVPQTLPRMTKDRLRCLKAILATEGPFSKYQADMEPKVDKLLEFSDLRHMMAHGLMTLEFDEISPENSQILFQLYVSGKKSEPLQLNRLRTSLATLGQAQDKVGVYSHEVIMMMYTIIVESELPPPMVLDKS